MPVNTYFGDVITTGNTILKQNLTVQGVFTYFGSNLGAATDQQGSIGPGTAWQNVYVTGSNATTMNLTSIPGPVGIGTSTGIGATVTVSGNILSVNTINTTNIFGTNQNITTLNTLALFGQSNIGIGTSTSLRATLQVQGNLAVSNAVQTTNVICTTLNTTTLNTLSLYGQSNIGIGTAPTGAALQVLGNFYTTNAFTTTNVIASGNLSYGEDLTKRYIHYIPDASNAASITAVISAKCNASSQTGKSWWPTSQLPNFGNAISAVVSNSSYTAGSVLQSDGDVVFVPNSSNLVSYSAKLNQLTVTTGLGFPAGEFNGGVLLPNGNVMFVPQDSNVGLYNPVIGTYSNSTAVPGGKYNGVAVPGGVILTPSGAPANVISYTHPAAIISNVLAIPSPNPTPSFSNATLSSSNLWSSAVWAPELGIWCAVAGMGGVRPINTTTAATSPDGITWTARTLPVSAAWTSVCWSPQLGLFCAVSGGISANGGTNTSSDAATSPDGITWTARTIIGTTAPSKKAWTSVCWSPQRAIFVAVAGNTNTSATSPDGITWTARTGAGSNAYSSVSWSPQLGLFCKVAGSVAGRIAADGTTIAETSPDGITWTSRTLPKLDNWSSVCWSPELRLFCTVGGGGAVGAGTTFTSSNAATSSDGITWNAQTLPVANYWSAVTWSPQAGQFLAICGGGDIRSSNAATSPDGVSWTSRTLANAWYMSDVQWSPQTGKFLILEGNKNGTTNTAALTSNVLLTTVPYRASTGALLTPAGNVAFSPAGSSNIMLMNYSTFAQSNIACGTDGFTGLVLAPTGNIVGVPLSANVISIDPAARTASNTAINQTGNVYGSFNGGVLLSYGNVLCIPGKSANVGMFNPVALTFSNSSQVGSNAYTNFNGGTLLPSGQVVMAPSWAGNVGVLNSVTPVAPELCLSPYFNKF